MQILAQFSIIFYMHMHGTHHDNGDPKPLCQRDLMLRVIQPLV